MNDSTQSFISRSPQRSYIPGFVQRSPVTRSRLRSLTPTRTGTLGGRDGYRFSARGHACAGRREHRTSWAWAGFARVSGSRHLTRFPLLLISSTWPRVPRLARVNQKATVLRGIEPSLFINGNIEIFHELLKYDYSPSEISREIWGKLTFRRTRHVR